MKEIDSYDKKQLFIFLKSMAVLLVEQQKQKNELQKKLAEQSKS
jgi:hypothetical protein